MLVVKIPPLVPFRYPLLTDWILIYLRHYKVEKAVYYNRLTGHIIFEIPNLPDQLIQTLREVGAQVTKE